MKKLLGTIFIMCFFIGLQAQTTVSGVVTDDSGEPLIGVNILEDGTTNGTITDLDGSYSISVSADATLVFSFTGMTTANEVVAGRTTINLVMETASELLDEVIVSALGFSVKKDETGSTASVVQPADIQRSGETTLLNALGAKASNVQIARSNGDPGAGSTIRIRGANSISGS